MYARDSDHSRPWHATFLKPQAAPPLFTMPGQIPATPGIDPTGPSAGLGYDPAALQQPGLQQQPQPAIDQACSALAGLRQN
jgi:hypothetical protein